MSEPVLGQKQAVGRPVRQEEVKAIRRRRQGGDERNLKLFVPESSKDPNFVYRWVNDRPGRVRQLTTMDDYDVVSTAELNGGDPDQMSNLSEGTVMTRTGDSRVGEKVVLVKKLREHYEADRKEYDRRLDARDEMLRKGQPPNQEGLSGKEAYVPGGKNIVAGR
jgi:hypothetical protein